MPLMPPRRRLRRRERARRRRFLGGAAVAVCILAGAVFQLSRTPAAVPAAVSEPRGSDPLPLATEPVGPSSDAVRGADDEPPAYPYSIVAGGTRSPAALRQAVAADPVVGRHYAHFDLARIQVVRLTQPRVAHVSYRIGNDVFWTKRPLLLKAGETLLTDGRHYARTRCGNQLAAAPAAVSPAEPSPEVLNTPLQRLAGTLFTVALPAGTGGALNASDPPAITGGGFPFPGGLIPPGGVRAPGTSTGEQGSTADDAGELPGWTTTPPSGGGPHGSPVPPSGDPFVPRIEDEDPFVPKDPEDPTPIPEPAMLLLTGLSALAWAGRRARRMRK